MRYDKISKEMVKCVFIFFAAIHLAIFITQLIYSLQGIFINKNHKSKWKILFKVVCIHLFLILSIGFMNMYAIIYISI
jgi:hypothetical protein